MMIEFLLNGCGKQVLIEGFPEILANATPGRAMNIVPDSFRLVVPVRVSGETGAADRRDQGR